MSVNAFFCFVVPIPQASFAQLSDPNFTINLLMSIGIDLTAATAMNTQMKTFVGNLLSQSSFAVTLTDVQKQYLVSLLTVFLLKIAGYYQGQFT